MNKIKWKLTYFANLIKLITESKREIPHIRQLYKLYIEIFKNIFNKNGIVYDKDDNQGNIYTLKTDVSNLLIDNSLLFIFIICKSCIVNSIYINSANYSVNTDTFCKTLNYESSTKIVINIKNDNLFIVTHCGVIIINLNDIDINKIDLFKSIKDNCTVYKYIPNQYYLEHLKDVNENANRNLLDFYWIIKKDQQVKDPIYLDILQDKELYGNFIAYTFVIIDKDQYIISFNIYEKTNNEKYLFIYSNLKAGVEKNINSMYNKNDMSKIILLRQAATEVVNIKYIQLNQDMKNNKIELLDIIKQMEEFNYE